MDERRLQRLPGTLPAHIGRRNPPQLVVDERRNFFSGRRVVGVGGHEPVFEQSQLLQALDALQ